MRELSPPLSQVFIIDDDPSLCKALKLVLEQDGLTVKTFNNAEDFLTYTLPECQCCAIIDMYLPGINGLELQQMIASQHTPLPVIILTGHGDIPTSVKAIKSGAVDYLVKPIRSDKLLETVLEALTKYPQLRDRADRRKQATQCLQRLTPREREIMLLAIQGYADKEIARCLNISYRTVEKHKSSLMHKTDSKKLLDLITLAHDGGLTTDESGVA